MCHRGAFRPVDCLSLSVRPPHIHTHLLFRPSFFLQLTPYHIMPPRRKSSITPKSEPKLFRCTGYGDCDMVFTRAEHLARHARKHTGEVSAVLPSHFSPLTFFGS